MACTSVPIGWDQMREGSSSMLPLNRFHAPAINIHNAAAAGNRLC